MMSTTEARSSSRIRFGIVPPLIARLLHRAIKAWYRATIKGVAQL
jgi:hypothetical protein